MSSHTRIAIATRETREAGGQPSNLASWNSIAPTSTELEPEGLMEAIWYLEEEEEVS